MEQVCALRLLCIAIAGRDLGLQSGLPQEIRQAAFTTRISEVICPGFGVGVLHSSSHVSNLGL